MSNEDQETILIPRFPSLQQPSLLLLQEFLEFSLADDNHQTVILDGLVLADDLPRLARKNTSAQQEQQPGTGGCTWH